MENNNEPPVTALTNDKWQPSSVRRMCAWSLAIAALLAILEALGFTDKDFDSHLTLFLYFLMAAFGGKAGQKFAEKWRG